MPLSTLAHDRSGSGETIVLIHGIGHRRQAWAPIFDRLAQSHDVIAVDLAGFGESPAYARSARYDMATAMVNLEENFTLWGIERPHVVGNSLGGAIALELGTRGLAASVTALSPAGFFGWAGRIQACCVLFPIRFVSLLPLFFLRWITGFAPVRKIAGAGLYAHPERVSAEALYGDAAALHHAKAFERTSLNIPSYSFRGRPKVPTTVAWGSRDRVLNPAQAEVARGRLPEAHHVSLPDCGHVPMIDDPELVIRVIEQTIAAAHSSGEGSRTTA